MSSISHSSTTTRSAARAAVGVADEHAQDVRGAREVAVAGAVADRLDSRIAGSGPKLSA